MEPINNNEILFDHNGVIQPLLTDFYQITMTYAYWKCKKHNDFAVFDLYFRRNPFQGEFTLFAGLEDCLKFISKFSYSKSDIAYIRTLLPDNTEEAFFAYLSSIDTSKIIVYAVEEGTIVFPKIPLIRLEGPLAIAQLLETTLLNLVNYASLVATNAARFRLAAGPTKKLLEFGLRRAQGPDGAMSASKYCFLGGFDATSNLLAGKLYGIPVKGTHAHSFVSSFNGVNDLINRKLMSKDGTKEFDLFERSQYWIKKLATCINFIESETIEGELAAFISYALAFPDEYLCLIDTYDVIRSGVPNFCAVAMALNDLGYKAIGVRLDSGDLAYLSNYVRNVFKECAKNYKIDWFEKLTIVASNDINEETIHSLNHQGHSIDSFGIGTHLVTCQKQPALGCVYKLSQVNDKARIKLSEDVAKVTLPGRKDVYRLYGAEGYALVDILIQPSEPCIQAGTKILCRHPFQEKKRAFVNPTKVQNLYKCFFKDGKIQVDLPSLIEVRKHAEMSLASIRLDHKRVLNPTPYKVSVSDRLYTFIHDLWLENAPIGELS